MFIVKEPTLDMMDLDFSSLLSLKKYAQEFSSFEQDFIYSRFCAPSPNRPIEPPQTSLFPGPVRIHGLACVIAMAGNLDIDINLTSYHLVPRSLLVAHDDSLMHVQKPDPNNGLDCYLLYLSQSLLHDTNLDLNVLQQASPKNFYDMPPVVEMSDSDVTMMSRYLELIHANVTLNTDPLIIRSISRSVMAAMFYQLIHIAKHINDAKDLKETDEKLTRQASYVRKFMELLHKYHASHRDLNFYASKLFISPKYLSLVVKNTTGRSASHWIDDFVILEAKNLLRFSHLSIQQIAAKLGFPDQSTFGKYFKKITSLSPSQYQKS